MVENSEQADERDKETVKVQGPGILPGEWTQRWGWTCPVLSHCCSCRPQSSQTPVSEGWSRLVLDLQYHRRFAAVHIGYNGRDFGSLLFFFPGKLSAVEPLIPGSLPRALWEIIW